MSGPERFDAVVVGSGAAGGWAAKQLCEAGLRVLVCEAGPRLDPAADLPLPAPSEQRLRSRMRGGLGGQAVQMRSASYSERTRRLFVSDRDNPYSTPAGSPFNWWRSRQVGGRLHIWARVSPRMTDSEFKGQSADGRGVDWPVGEVDLAPHYEAVERFLGVTEVEHTPAEEDFAARVHAALPGLEVCRPRIMGDQPQPLPPTLEAAQRTGLLALNPDCVVDRVTVDGRTGSATGVTWIGRESRERGEARAGAVLLCAGAFETVRLMLSSACERHPHGLGNSSGRLGTGVIDQVTAGIGGPLPGGVEPEPWPEDSSPYDFGRVTGVYVPRFRNTGEAVSHPFPRGYSMQGSVGRGTRYWYLLAHGEMLPRSENRITLDPRRTDAWGQPTLRVECTYSAEEERMAVDAASVMADMARAAGLPVANPPSGRALDALAFRLWRRRLMGPSGAFHPGSAIHEAGGAAMGESAGTSVTDPFGRCWDAGNVFVCDGAAFPSGGCQNVTLTIMALAVRASAHLAERHRAGELA